MNTNNEIVKDLKELLQTILYKEETQTAFIISQAIEIINNQETKIKDTKIKAYKECMSRVEDRLSRRIGPESFPYIRDVLHDELEKMVGEIDG